MTCSQESWNVFSSTLPTAARLSPAAGTKSVLRPFIELVAHLSDVALSWTKSVTTCYSPSIKFVFQSHSAATVPMPPLKRLSIFISEPETLFCLKYKNKLSNRWHTVFDTPASNKSTEAIFRATHQHTHKQAQYFSFSKFLHLYCKLRINKNGKSIVMSCFRYTK